MTDPHPDRTAPVDEVKPSREERASRFIDDHVHLIGYDGIMSYADRRIEKSEDVMTEAILHNIKEMRE